MAFPRLVRAPEPPNALAPRSDDELMELSRAACGAFGFGNATPLVIVNLCGRSLPTRRWPELAQDTWVLVWQARENTGVAAASSLVVTLARHHCRKSCASKLALTCDRGRFKRCGRRGS